MYDVLCVGNALIDAFLQLHEANQHCRLDPATNELSFKSGEKIPLDASQFLPGGNANNVSVGLARLGLRTGLVAEIGTDEFGDAVFNNLTQQHVDTTHLIRTAGQSSFAISINFKGERTLFVQHLLRQHAFSLENTQTQWIYLTSLGKEWQHVYQEVATYVKERGIKLAFNPGTPQLEAGIEQLRHVFAVAYVVFLNKEEAQQVTGEKTDEMQALLRSVQALGSQYAVITDGEKGSFVITPEKTCYHLPSSPTTVVEKTGAGDAYATGFTAAMVKGLPVQDAMQWGAANAASVIAQIGAQPGLLTQDTLTHRLTENKLVVQTL